MADPILGFGTKLEVDHGAGFVEIARMLEIGAFGGQGDEVETTVHDSSGTNTGFREYIRGLQDPGEVTLRGQWIGDADQVELMNDSLGGAFVDSLKPYRITLPQGRGTFNVQGFMREFQINPQMDGVLEFTGVLRISGQPEFATTVSAGLTTPFFAVTPNAGAAATYVPVRAQATTEYVVTLDTIAVSFTVTPTAAVGVITVDGTVVASGVPSGSIALGAAGSVTDVVIEVKATGSVAKQYELHVVRP